jgi:hypothetical protein
MNLGFKIHFKAVVIGVVAGLALGFLVGPLETLFLFGPSLSGTSLHIVSLALGSLATLLAAYLTARMSPTDELANVLVFWAVNEVFGLLSLLVLTFPLWYNITGTFAIFIASLAGWYIERMTRHAA